jgi:hypothetical protein
MIISRPPIVGLVCPPPLIESFIADRSTELSRALLNFVKRSLP